MTAPWIPPPTLTRIGEQAVLFSLLGANMNSTADQALNKAFGFTAFTIEKIIVTNASTSLTLAAGGFYGAPSKSAPVLVLAVQAYSALTGSTVILNPTLQAAAQVRLTLSNIYLSLTTAQGSAATADVYVIGVALS